MAKFQYTGKSSEGQSIQGEIIATTSQEAIQLLRQQDLFVTRLKEKVSWGNHSRYGNFSWRNPQVSNKDLVHFTHQLATLVRAGVPLLECLEIVGMEVENSEWQPVIRHIRAEVEQGALLAQSLAHFPTIFHEFYRRMVEAGESTGRLDESLSQLAGYLDKQAQLRAKIVSALSYPAMLVAVALTVFVFLLIWVVPLFSGLFKEFGESLPWLTQMVLDVSVGLRTHSLAFLGLLGCLFVGGRFLVPHGKRRQFMDGMLLRLPLIGTMFRKSAVVRFARTLGFLVRRGVPLLSGLSVAAGVTGNSLIEQRILAVVPGVQDGMPLSETLCASGAFPPMVTQMIRVGESTGSLDAMLEKVADLFEQEVDRAIATLTSVLEPCVIVIVGSGIALVVIAMYLPIFSIGSIIG